MTPRREGKKSQFLSAVHSSEQNHATNLYYIDIHQTTLTNCCSSQCVTSLLYTFRVDDFFYRDRCLL